VAQTVAKLLTEAHRAARFMIEGLRAQFPGFLPGVYYQMWTDSDKTPRGLLAIMRKRLKEQAAAAAADDTVGAFSLFDDPEEVVPQAAAVPEAKEPKPAPEEDPRADEQWVQEVRSLAIARSRMCGPA
jgi:hypothetical protein